MRRAFTLNNLFELNLWAENGSQADGQFFFVGFQFFVRSSLVWIRLWGDKWLIFWSTTKFFDKIVRIRKKSIFHFNFRIFSQFSNFSRDFRIFSAIYEFFRYFRKLFFFHLFKMWIWSKTFPKPIIKFKKNKMSTTAFKISHMIIIMCLWQQTIYNAISCTSETYLREERRRRKMAYK